MTRIDPAECDLADAHSERCAAGCSSCALSEAAQRPGKDALRGWSFASAAAQYFLVPLVLACIGAALGEGHSGQLMGALAGLVGGMAVTSWLAGRRHGTEETAWQQR